MIHSVLSLEGEELIDQQHMGTLFFQFYAQLFSSSHPRRMEECI